MSAAKTKTASRWPWLKKDHPHVQLALLVLMLLTFFAKNTTEIPALTWFLAPDYLQCQKAISRLENSGKLQSTDEGFAKLSSAFINWLQENKDRAKIQGAIPPDLQVESMEVTMTMGFAGFGSTESLEVALYSPFSHRIGSVGCDMATLRKIADDLRDKDAFAWSWVLFMISFAGELWFIYLNILRQNGASSLPSITDSVPPEPAADLPNAQPTPSTEESTVTSLSRNSAADAPSE